MNNEQKDWCYWNLPPKKRQKKSALIIVTQDKAGYETYQDEDGIALVSEDEVRLLNRIVHNLLPLECCAIVSSSVKAKQIEDKQKQNKS